VSELEIGKRVELLQEADAQEGLVNGIHYYLTSNIRHLEKEDGRIQCPECELGFTNARDIRDHFAKMHYLLEAKLIESKRGASNSTYQRNRMTKKMRLQESLEPTQGNQHNLFILDDDDDASISNNPTISLNGPSQSIPHSVISGLDHYN
jgi:hypothetical protein